MITKTRADEEAGKIIKRRISWQTLWRIRPDLKPAANDDKPDQVREAA